MPDGASLAAVTMREEAARIETTGLNLVNATTPAYKRQVPVSSSRVAFGNLLEALSPGAQGQHGAAVGIDFRPGALRSTGNALDLAIEGDAFFELKDNGRTVYTRQGSFTLDTAGRIQDRHCALLQGIAGEIKLESGNPRIDGEGRVFEKSVQVGQLRLVRFADPARLEPLPNGHFLAGQAEALPASQGKRSLTRQGFLEESNVVAADEMLRLMESMRRFEGGQRVMLWYDDMNDQALQRLGAF